MSLLDDVSIVVTPNGYKAGELYSVVPVPTEGAEMLSQPVDLVTDFLVNSGGVIVDADTFTTAGGTFDGIRINSFFTIGKRYKLIIDGDTTSSGFTIGETTLSGNEYGSGFGTHYFTPIGTGSIWLRQQTAGTTNITSFSIKEYTAADMDVTRATAATRVDENGLVNYAEVLGDSALTGNNSNFDTGIGSWTTYIGGSLAHDTDKLEVTLLATGSGARINTNSLISGGQTGKTFKVRAKIWQGTTTATSLNIYLGSSQELVTISSTPTYFEVLLTPSNTGYLTIYRGSSSGGTFFIDDVTVKEVTRDNVPRIDYTGGGCPHILSEPMRTNLIPYSEDFDAYRIAGSTVTPNSTTAPDGTNSGILVTQGISTLVLRASNVVAPSTTYTFSGYFKSSSSVTQVTLDITDTGNTTFDLTSEWQRFSITAESRPGGSPYHFVDVATNGIQGDTFYAWGLQVEEGSYGTSYIPNFGTAAGVTRNQDIFTRDGIGSLINSTEGVLFAEWKPKISSDYSFFSINNGTSSETVTIGKSNNTTSMFVGVRHLGAYKILYVSSSHDLTIFNKVAVKWKAGDYAIWVNGVEVLTSTSATIPTAMNKLSFDFGDGGFDFYGEIKQLQVYNTALTDEQLLQLTGTSGTDFYESYAEMASALTYTIQ